MNSSGGKRIRKAAQTAGILFFAAAISMPFSAAAAQRDTGASLDSLRQTAKDADDLLAVAYLVGAAAKAVSKKCLGVWFPLVALNSAVLGVTLNNVAEGYSLLQALVSSVAVGLGFLLAMVVFCGVRSKIEEQYVPKAFRGLPIHLMAASILALALFAF